MHRCTHRVVAPLPPRTLLFCGIVTQYSAHSQHGTVQAVSTRDWLAAQRSSPTVVEKPGGPPSSAQLQVTPLEKLWKAQGGDTAASFCFRAAQVRLVRTFAPPGLYQRTVMGGEGENTPEVSQAEAVTARGLPPPPPLSSAFFFAVGLPVCFSLPPSAMEKEGEVGGCKAATCSTTPSVSCLYACVTDSVLLTHLSTDSLHSEPLCSPFFTEAPDATSHYHLHDDAASPVACSVVDGNHCGAGACSPTANRRASLGLLSTGSWRAWRRNVGALSGIATLSEVSGHSGPEKELLAWLDECEDCKAVDRGPS